MQSWITDPALRIIALVGISKNSGKTTLLNHLIQSHPGLGWGVMTTGIDGEEEDAVFKTAKPKVRLLTGNIFCCESHTADLHGSKATILHGETCSGRKLWLTQALEPLETEITGPAAVSSQIKIARRMQRLGAQKVLIDGSLDRKSIALEPEVQALILAIGASYGSTGQIVDEVGRLKLLASLPAVQFSNHTMRRLRQSTTILAMSPSGWRATALSSLIGNEKHFHSILENTPRAVYIPGAYTSILHHKLGKALAQSGAKIIFRHPECLKLELGELQGFLGQNQVQCLIPFRLKGFFLNSWAVAKPAPDAMNFRSVLRDAFPQEDFIDIRELG